MHQKLHSINFLVHKVFLTPVSAQGGPTELPLKTTFGKEFWHETCIDICIHLKQPYKSEKKIKTLTVSKWRPLY